MKIEGKQIADSILEKLKLDVIALKKKNITPCLAILLIGNDPASATYVRQKELKAKYVGIEAQTIHLPTSISQEELLLTIQQCNNDNNVHGIIIQRPLPPHIDETQIDNAVDRLKDVDGFRSDSQFLPPLGIAVYKILEHIPDFSTKKIAIIGKGKTGGSPIMQVLSKRGIHFVVIDTKTPDASKIIKEADIVIAAVGKPHVIKKDMLRKGVILIGVGMFRDGDGKLHGDYEEEEIKNIASKYTPIPGGIGPVNVACLLENVVHGAST